MNFGSAEVKSQMAAFCFGVKEINQGDLYNSSNEKLKTIATYIADR